MRDFPSVLSDCSFFNCVFLELCDCSSSKALSFLATALDLTEDDGGRWLRRNDEEWRGVCLDAVKKIGAGDFG